MQLRVAGLTIELRAGDSLSGLLASYYAAMAGDSPHAADASIDARDDEATLSVGSAAPQRYRIASPAAAPTVAAALVLRAIAQARPDIEFLHGNALLDGEAGRAVLVVGESGAGKTTLARGLLAADPRIEPLSEDVLVLDPARRALHPFPRTPTVEPAAAPAGAPAWGGKSLLPWTGTRGTDSVSLDGARVVVLERPRAPSAEPCDDDAALRVLVPWFDDGAATRIARGCPSFRGWQRTGDLFELAFEPLPRAAELRRAAQLLDDGGSLLLATEIAAPRAASRAAESPEVGIARAMDGGEAIAALAAHRISPHPAARSEPGAFMAALARALGTARFVRLRRAAVPADTARIALAAVRGDGT